MTTENVIGIDAKIARNTEIISTDMDDETVMMSIDKGEYYGVNPVGSRVWELLESPRTVSGLCETLLREYDVPQEQCHKDIMSFLNHLSEKGLIAIG